MDPKVWATDPRVAFDVVNPHGAFLPALLFFANARAWSRHAGGVNREDAELLASACDAVFAGHRNPAVMNPRTGVQSAQLDAASLLRVRRRCVEAARFALAALAKPQFTRFWGGTIATADGRRVEVGPVLAQTVLRVTDPWAWGAGAGGASSADAALREVCERGGMKTLAEAIEMHLPQTEGGGATRSTATTPATRSAVEELACALCERVAQSRADAHARRDLTLAARVFGVKNLWRRFIAGGAVDRSAPVMWAYAVDTLHERSIDSLPDETVGDTSDWHFHKRADAGFHLGNLAEAAPAGLARFARSNPEGRWRVAVRFAAVASALLETLPPGASISTTAGDASADAMQIDGGGGSGDADERFSDSDDDEEEEEENDEAEHRAARRRRVAKHSSRTDGRSYPPLRREVTRQLATLRSADTYNALVAAALPGEGAWPSATYPAPAFGSSGGVPAFGSTAATAPAFGSAAATAPTDPLDPARAAEIGLRTVSALVVAASSRLRASDRGDVMRSLAFGGFVNAAWTVLGRMQARRAWPVVGGGAIPIRGERPGFEGSQETLGTTRSMNEAWVTSLGVFAEAYGTFLLTGDDEEFRDGRPLPASEFPNLVACLRDSLWHILWVEGDPDSYRITPGPDSAARWTSRGPVTRSLARALAQLHDRNGRLRLVPPDDFIATEFRGGSLGSDGAVEAFLNEAAKTGRKNRAKELLRRAPSLVPFGARVRWFKAEVLRDREENAGRGVMAESWGLAREHHIQINRGRVFDDALAALGPAVLSGDQATWRREHPDERPPGSLKGIVRVQFTNEHGVEEAGVDGGGLFKDFLNDLIAEAFDPVKTGLFAETPDRTLYPNPASVRRCGPDHLRKLEFLGAMLGKAVYEGILVDLPLAGFFLAKLRDGRPPELNDLATLDPELYHHLLSLKRLPSDQVEDLFLHFTATDAATGGDKELAPGGSDVRVTAANRTRYVHLMAHHLLHQQVRQQSDAFVRGFRALVAPSWLRVFAPAELRLLIAGAGGRIDVGDLARSAAYSGGYGPDHPTVVALWQAVNEFTEEEQRDLLRFVTACPNTPLLGFGQLTPPFCVHRAGMTGGSHGSEADADTARLPTAATCMNLLKLPPYRTKEQVRKKLLYAIKSGSGFDLS